MKRKIRIGAWLISLSIAISLIGCNQLNDEKIQRNFDEFLDELPIIMIKNNDMNVEYFFNNPISYGFEDELLELPYITKNDYLESNEDSKKLIGQLDKFKYKELTDEQKLTYDILKDYLERNIIEEDYYVISNNNLGSFTGFQAQLPLILSEYTFEDKNDLKSYFNIIETSPEIFEKYADFEEYRQEEGVGMSQDILNLVIEQCKNFTEDEDVFLIDSINEKIDEVTFLNNEEKIDAKKKNEELIKNNFLEAYKILAEELSDIKASKDEVGLAKLPNGKEYYEYLIKKNTGIDDSIEDIKKYLENKFDDYMEELNKLYEEHPKVLEKIDLENIKYTSMKSFEENIDYLQEQSKKDFPDIGEIKYNITKVPDSMKENFSPAAYLQGKIDSNEEETQQIWVNGDYDQSLFSTLAHEGIAGHMYQNVYFQRLGLPTIRYMIDYNGYSEGWATYIENTSFKYADVSDEDKIKLEIINVNNKVSQVLTCLFDIEINYYGISYEEYKKRFSETFGIIDDETIKSQYDLFIELPGNYLDYYLTAMKYQDLYNKAEENLGDKFKSIDFNKVLLETGPAPLKILEEQVDKYIDGYK